MVLSLYNNLGGNISMLMKFYELKFRAMENFYNVISEENYTFEQAADRTYYEFSQEVNSKKLKA